MPAQKKPTSKRAARRSGGDSTMYKGKAPYGRTEDGQPYTKKGITARAAEGPKKTSPRSGVGKGAGRGVAMNKPSTKKRGR